MTLPTRVRRPSEVNQTIAAPLESLASLPGIGTGATRIVPKVMVREGDTLTVSYPEINIQLKQYTNCKVGGLSYTRVLHHGDDLDAEYASIYGFLRASADADAREKIRTYAAELNAKG